MIKIESIFLIIILLLSGIVTATISQDLTNEKNIFTKIEKIEISSPIIRNKDQFLTIDFNESKSYLSEPGKPMLPKISKTFIFPLRTEIVNINIDVKTQLYSVSNLIHPSPCELNNYENNNLVLSYDCNINKSFYSTDIFYPEKPYFIQRGAGVIDNNHVLFMNIYVIPQYNPVKSIISIPYEINVIIDYIPYNNILSFYDEYDMVIISPKSYSNNLQPLINHKNNHGIKTFLKTTEEIYDEYQGRDKPEQIKYFIKDAIENFDIDYVLLVGDIDSLPMRLCDITIELWSMRWVLSDLYYGDIYDANSNFSTWDSNNNDIFCEIYCPADGSVRNEDVYIDTVDLYPDVGVGRLPCRNARELDDIISKIINYETMTFSDDWFHTILLMGGDTFTSSSWADCGENEGEIVCDQIAEILPDFKSIKLYTSTKNFRPLNINRVLNSGVGFVGYSGHGFEYGFGTHPTDNDHLIMYYTPYLLGLHNNRLPIFFFCACLTAKLDFNINNHSIPCFAYSLLKQRHGGSIACIGSTQLSYGWVFQSGSDSGSPYLQLSFWDSFEDGIHLADLFTAAQTKYLNDLGIDGLTLGEFILIGDPSLKIGGYKIL